MTNSLIVKSQVTLFLHKELDIINIVPANQRLVNSLLFLESTEIKWLKIGENIRNRHI